MKSLEKIQLEGISAGGFWEGLTCGVVVGLAILEPTPAGEFAAAAICATLLSAE